LGANNKILSAKIVRHTTSTFDAIGRRYI